MRKRNLNLESVNNQGNKRNRRKLPLEQKLLQPLLRDALAAWCNNNPQWTRKSLNRFNLGIFFFNSGHIHKQNSSANRKLSLRYQEPHKRKRKNMLDYGSPHVSTRHHEGDIFFLFVGTQEKTMVFLCKTRLCDMK